MNIFQFVPFREGDMCFNQRIDNINRTVKFNATIDRTGVAVKASEQFDAGAECYFDMSCDIESTITKYYCKINLQVGGSGNFALTTSVKNNTENPAITGKISAIVSKKNILKVTEEIYI